MSDKKKIHKRFLHDHLFKDVYTKEKYSLDLFRLIFTKKEYSLFNWKTLKAEVTTFIDPQWHEKRTDVIFSVELKENGKQANIVLLLEHKSSQESNVLKQLLDYQALIYSRHNGPVIPIIIYHGKKKRWDKPLNFHDSLEGWTPILKELFGDNILNFKCKLLNIQLLDIDTDAKDLTSKPILYIL